MLCGVFRMFAKAGVRRRSQRLAVGVVTKQGGHLLVPFVTSQSQHVAALKKSLAKILYCTVFQFVFYCDTAPTLPPSGKALPSSTSPADRDFPPGPGPAAGSLSATFLRASGPINDLTAFCPVNADIRVHSAALFAPSHQANYFPAAPPNRPSAAAPGRTPKHEPSAAAFGILAAEREPRERVRESHAVERSLHSESDGSKTSSLCCAETWSKVQAGEPISRAAAKSFVRPSDQREPSLF